MIFDGLKLQLIDVKLGLSKTNLSIKELFTLQLVFFDTIFIMFIKILFNYQGKRTRYQAWPSAKDLFYPFLAMPTSFHNDVIKKL
jgi:hypothetical protein